MLGFVVEDLVVNFIGENDQIMLTSDLHDLLQQFFGIDRAGGVVRLMITIRGCAV